MKGPAPPRILLLLLALGPPAACDSDRRSGDGRGTVASKGSREVRVEWVGPALEAGELRIRVEVPPNHHGYLDAGDDGFFVPFAFSFDATEEKGLEVVARSRPLGERDESVRATVLRGMGEFVFSVRGEGGRPQGDATLRYQICNDSTGVCYPPEEVPVSLPGTLP